MEQEIRLTHVCFIDLVGFSMKPTLEQLSSIVSLGETIKEALSSRVDEDHLVISLGDGAAICFWNSPEHALLVALQVSRSLRLYNERLLPQYRVLARIGLHSGPTSQADDILGQKTVVGSGINVAARVLNLCAPDQILASQEFFRFLGDNPSYTSLFSSLGVYEVKHGITLHIYNVFGNWNDTSVGNPKSAGILSKPAETKKAIEQPQKYAFVIMSFSSDDPLLVDVYNCIRSVCVGRGVFAERVDDIEYSGRVTDRIVNCIKRADIIIADLTHERPNVYYEIGLAHGQNNDVVLIARQDTKLHFDLSGFNVIFYKNITELTIRLDKRIIAIMGSKY